MKKKLVTVRKADTGDAALIAGLSRSSFYEAFAHLNEPQHVEKFMRDQFSREKLMAEVGVPGNYFFLASLDQEWTGYMKMRINEHPEDRPGPDAIEIERIYSVSRAIGRGVGKALMETALAHARELGKTTIWLGVWEHNLSAQAFYARWGFEKYGEHRFWLGDDLQTDWLMKRPV